MGQYYMPLVERNNRKVGNFDSHDYNCGLKLMEHSWIGNKLLNAVYATINDCSANIAWIGDYSNDSYEDGNKERYPYTSILTYEEFKKKYDKAWKRKSKTSMWYDVNKVYDVDIFEMALVNHTKKIFLDLDEYKEENMDDNGWCINPLSLLTACGNGMGGGDYHSCVGKDDVGTWAFDLIEYTSLESVPKEYEKVQYTFSES